MISITRIKAAAIASALAGLLSTTVFAQPSDPAKNNKDENRGAGVAVKPREEDYYRIITIPLPDDCELEVGGLAWLDAQQTRLLACTRRGELWLLDNVYADQPVLGGTKTALEKQNKNTTKNAAKPLAVKQPDPAQIVRFTRMLFGLHEPLGLVVNPGHGFPNGIYTAQRSELTRLEDTNGDDRIDVVDSFCKGWQISGGYHEYAFGPKLDKQGRLWITLNIPFGEGQEAKAHWRGWAVTVDNQGKMHPVCPGLRSPAGLGMNTAGDMFYTDNQGDHVAVCKLSHMKPDTFQGNPHGLRSTELPLSNFEKPSKDYPKKPLLWAEAVAANPKLQAPAVWFPYPALGQSHTDVIADTTGGKFGPFTEQLFVGDLSSAQLVRVFLEKIDGEYQGACFAFRKGFQPPILRATWGHDGSMFLGGSSRGWGGGSRPYGLQRLVWRGETPFEIHEMRAEPDGFTLYFTKPVDPKTAADPDSYRMQSWTYRYHSDYGDKPRDTQELKIAGATVAADHKSVRLTIDGLKPYYVHELKVTGVLNQDGQPVLHDTAHYTLNRIPKSPRQRDR